MATFHQFGLHSLGDRLPGRRRPKSELIHMLLAAAFVVSICLIAIVIGAASAQTP